MAIAQYYRFTPCCKSAHPSYFNVPVTPLPNLPFVYNYTGPTVIDSMGYQLEAGKCYLVEQLNSNDLSWVAGLVLCPEPNPVTLLPFTDISAVCPSNPTPECPCVIEPNSIYSVYSLQPCCGSTPTIVYLVNESLVDGTTYIYGAEIPDGDLISPSCYTATEITYTGIGVPPFTQVILSEFVEVTEGCGDNVGPLTSVCELFCKPCTCTRLIWTGIRAEGTFFIVYLDCNYQLQLLPIPTDGVTWTDKVCIRYIVSSCFSTDFCWSAETFGNCTVDNTDINDIQYDCPACYELRDCTGIKPSIYTFSNQVAQYVATQQVIQIVGDETCWRVFDTDDDCECAIDVSVDFVFDDCPSCLNPKGYKLTECTTGEVQYTTTDLSEYTTAILQTDCPGCWEIEPIDIVPPSSLPVTVNASFDDCKTCNATFYELVDCNRIKDNIITIDDLSDYVGKVIKIKYCPETCWEVNVTTPKEITGTIYLDEVHADCTECLLTLPAQCVTFTNSLAGSTSFSYTDIYGQSQKAQIAGKTTTPKLCVLGWDININITVNIFGDCIDGQCPTPPQPKRKVTPGYNTAVCSTEYYEKVECNFADGMYKDVLQQRYGISNCCPEDLMKWEIKHEMLILDILVNPDYNCLPDSTCDCPTIGCPVTYGTCPEITNYIIERCNEPGVTEVVRIENQYDVLGNVIVIDDLCYTVTAPTNRLVTVYWTPGIIYETCEDAGCPGTPIQLPCEDCIKINATPTGGAPIEIVVPVTGTYQNGTSYYFFTIDNIDYEIYNETWNTTDPPGAWLLYAYDSQDDIGALRSSTCPIGTYTVDPDYFESFVIDYCGGIPTGFVLYSVFLDTGGLTGVYFTYPDCNNVIQQYNLQPAKNITTALVCSTPGRLPTDFSAFGGTDFSVVETIIPCNC
jgi:hypothetical protein